MPTYEYRCPSCGHQFEQFQSITEKPVEVCPLCKAKPERLISGGAGLLFKGSGFYITDYRSKEYRQKAKNDKPAKESSPSGSSSGASGDSSGSSESSTAGKSSDGDAKSQSKKT